MKIKTVGVVLTDQKGSIVGEDGKPAFMFMPSSVRKLDQAIMRRAIMSQKNPIIVIGESTFNEIKNKKLGSLLDSMGCPVFVSNSEGVSVYRTANSKDFDFLHEYDKDSDTKEQLRRVVYSSAYVGSLSFDGRDTYTIVVLGGHSVYEAFNYHYTEIHHNQYQKDINGDRHINVLGDDPRLVYDMTAEESSMMVEDQTVVMYSDSDFVYYVHSTGE